MLYRATQLACYGEITEQTKIAEYLSGLQPAFLSLCRAHKLQDLTSGVAGKTFKAAEIRP